MAAPGEYVNEMTGTATAASFVAALIAFMLQMFPKLRKNPIEIISRLERTSNGTRKDFE